VKQCTAILNLFDPCCELLRHTLKSMLGLLLIAVRGRTECTTRVLWCSVNCHCCCSHPYRKDLFKWNGFTWDASSDISTSVRSTLL